MKHAVRVVALTAAGLVWVSGSGPCAAEDGKASEPPVATAPQPALAPAAAPAPAQIPFLREEVMAARRGFETARARFQVGQETQASVQQAESRLRLAELALRQAEEKAAREARLALLQRPVNIKLTDASLKQAAVVISQAAGLPVVIDADVPVEKRLTVDAKGVTLGLVLETVAQKADLMLAPDPKGIRISAWPVIVVDGQRTVRKSDNAPWSEDWVGYLYYGAQDARGPFASGGGVLFSTGGPQGFAEAVPAPTLELTPAPPFVPRDPLPLYPLNLSRAASGVNISPIGEKSLVVSEPGTGPAGEAGLWLTVYRLEGDQLKKVSATFHATRAPLSAFDYNGRLRPPTATPFSRVAPARPSAPPTAVPTAPAPLAPPTRAVPGMGAPTAPKPPRVVPPEPKTAPAPPTGAPR